MLGRCLLALTLASTSPCDVALLVALAIDSCLEGAVFIVYVNNIPQTLSSLTHLFADNCAIYHKVSSQRDCQSL